MNPQFSNAKELELDSSSNGKNRTLTLLVILFVIIYLLGVVMSLGISHKPWGDEHHFIKTSIYFGSTTFSKAIADYEELVPPLTFILYALWGKIFGFENSVLRLFSLLVAALTFLTYFYLMQKTFVKPKLALAALAVFLLNPYTIGLSLFVFTDMLMIFFLLLFLFSVMQKKFTLLFISAACGLLLRQYFIFVIAAGIIFLLFQKRTSGGRNFNKMFWIIAAACLPLLCLMILWQGPAPPAGISLWITSNSALFNPSAITLYIGIMFIYVSPIALFKWEKFIFKPIAHLIIMAISFSYFIFPVHASEVSLQIGRETVGLFHRALNQVLSSDWLVHAVFYFCYLFGLHLLAGFAKEVRKLFSTKIFSFKVLLFMMIVSFFIVMPFSYQVWEKYTLPLVPIVSIFLLLPEEKKVVS